MKIIQKIHMGRKLMSFVLSAIWHPAFSFLRWLIFSKKKMTSCSLATKEGNLSSQPTRINIYIDELKWKSGGWKRMIIHHSLLMFKAPKYPLKMWETWEIKHLFITCAPKFTNNVAGGFTHLDRWDEIFLTLEKALKGLFHLGCPKWWWLWVCWVMQ